MIIMFNISLFSFFFLLTTISCSSQVDWVSTPQDDLPADSSSSSSAKSAFADANTPDPSITPHDITAFSGAPDSPVALLPNEGATNGQIASSETSPGVPNPINAVDRQDVAFQEGDSGVAIFPWNVIPVLGGDKPLIDLPSLFDGKPMPTIPKDNSSPQAERYDDNERLADPSNPDCDGAKYAMCCSVSAPMQPLAVKNLHKRRRCYACRNLFLYQLSDGFAESHFASSIIFPVVSLGFKSCCTQVSFVMANPVF